MATRRCASCGHDNSSDAAFCANPACGIYLGWQALPPDAPSPAAVAPVAGWGTQSSAANGGPATAAATSAASGVAPQPPTPASPGRSRPAASGPADRAYTRLDTECVRVEPGEQASAELTIRNAGTVVEQFVVSVTGVPTAWVSVDPPRVNLDVDSEQRCRITLRPPRLPSTSSGRANLTVSVVSSVDHAVVATLHLGAEVGTFADLHSELAPFESEGKRESEHQLVVTNDGNGSAAVAFTGTDQADKVSIDFDPRHVELQPAQQAFVRVSVHPKRRMWFGASKRHPFTVDVMTPTGKPTQLNASMNQLARFPGWVPKAVAVVLAVLLAAGVPFGMYLLNKNDKAQADKKPVSIPTLEGQTFDQASQQLRDLGLVVLKAPEEVSQGQRGTVVKVDPPAGSQVQKRSSVTLTVSAGPGRAAIPNLEAFPVADAQRALEGLGLKVRTNPVAIPSRNIPQGLVLRTEPPATVEVDLGKEVVVVLSDGPPPKPLPQVVGRPSTDAINGLVAAGFAIGPGSTATTADQTQWGIVKACTIADASKTPCGPTAKEGTAVSLVVYVAGDKVKVPPLTGLTQADAQAALEKSLLKLGNSTKKPDATVPVGMVLATKPAVGTDTPKGSPVDLVVSSGPPVTVPTVTGQTIADAKTAVTAAGLTPNPGVCADTETVTSQTPAASSLISKGDMVNLGCSRTCYTCRIRVEVIDRVGTTPPGG